MKINFKTCKMHDGNEWVIINANFDRLFALKQSQGFALFYDEIDGEHKHGWVNHNGEPIGGFHDETYDFVNNFARFQDNKKQGWVNRNGEQIGGLHYSTGNFVNDFAQFQDIIDGNGKWGWINRKGEQIGGLHDSVYDFNNNFARFIDIISGKVKQGWINEQGEQIGGLHNSVYDFVHNFARFEDNGKYGFVNSNGEQLGKLYKAVYDFNNNFARFKESTGASWSWRYGYLSEIGLEFRRNDLNYDESEADYKILKELEFPYKMFHPFPMKFYIFRKIYER